MIYMIKNRLKLILILFLSSCSIDLFEQFSYREIFIFYKGYIAGFDSDVISQEVFDKYEYSFANVKIGRGAASTVVLAYIRDGVYEWRSNDGITIYTYNGMIIETIGFQSDFKIDPFDVLDQSLEGNDFITYLEFKNPDLYRSKVNNRVFKHKTHNKIIDRLGGEINAEILSHSFRLPIIKWKGENQFYIYDERVIRSEQYIHPNMPVIKIDFYLK
tara:strand:- start:1754 stop:2401 length:648 start_codon:yes stop_codon:yes gene_type:complete